MNDIMLKEKAVYVRQGGVKKYDKIWKSWWDIRGINTEKERVKVGRRDVT